MDLLNNRRILVIDDEPSMHTDFQHVLAPHRPLAVEAAVDGLEAQLFDDAPPRARLSFELSCAHQGRDGAELARTSLSQGRPFAVAFVDMRMPPGWDGLRTVQELWTVDSRLQVVICTAYSDAAWDSVITQLDPQDGLLIIKKPFDPVEVLQAAQTLSTKWSRAREAEARIAALELSLAECSTALNALRAADPHAMR